MNDVETNSGPRCYWLVDQMMYKDLREIGSSPPVEIPDRPDVIDTMMSIAFVVSKRSPDAQTKHGCVITTPDFRVLSTGYNGFPRDMDYSLLPNTRPDKYPWMMHAERNALAWCQNRPVDCIAFITGESCFGCITALWQHGISHVYEVIGHGSHLIDEKEKKRKKIFVDNCGITLHPISMKESWVK